MGAGCGDETRKGRNAMRGNSALGAMCGCVIGFALLGCHQHHNATTRPAAMSADSHNGMHATAGAGQARLLAKLGDMHHAVATKNAEAQKYFDQGLTLCYAFNHDEAIRSFRKAAELDPKLGM